VDRELRELGDEERIDIHADGSDLLYSSAF
jgi:hypothetical protein